MNRVKFKRMRGVDADQLPSYIILMSSCGMNDMATMASPIL